MLENRPGNGENQMNRINHDTAPQQREASLLAKAAPDSATPPWQEIEAGRFMPRRIRGSCQGRELG
jgi:hypothetical protein